MQQEPPPLPLSSRLQREIEEFGLEFLSRFYEIETGRHPGNLDALAELGHVYSRQGRYEEGLAVDRRLVRLAPHNPTVHYNLACSLAILDRRDAALDALETAVELGYDDVDFMTKDQDLARVREEDRFRRLVERIGERPGT